MIIGGIVPAVLFIATWHPRKIFSLEQFDAGGWVYAFLFLYVFSFVINIFTPVPSFTLPRQVLNLALGLGIDGTLWARYVRWRRIQNDVTDLGRREFDQK